MATQPMPTATTGPLETVHQYVNAFNRGDVTGMMAAFAGPGAILDGMPPHVWDGPTATQDWYRDVLATTEKEDATDFFVTLGEPLHADVTGDSAYIVVPAEMAFRVYGKHITQSGAIFTIALRRLTQGWRIRSWAWTKGQPEVM